jgi:beta-aspartyl-peptidase (threonine type)
MPYAIVVHGGAINPLTEPFNSGVTQAAFAGYEVLKRNGTALDAVTEAVRTMEDNPIFNAGTGAWPNLSGEIEMDAVIVDGKKISTGAVACIRRVKNPVLVAKKVMEETDHILLVGEGATKFARSVGFPDYDPLTKDRMTEWSALKEKVRRGEQTSMMKYWSKISKFATADTVGAVALSTKGDMAAATSSGGFPLKLPGRVGDVPIINCSTYASNRVGGVSLSGHGEIIIKEILARRIHDRMTTGEHPQVAIERAIEETLSHLESREGVLMAGIALDKDGNVGMARNVDLTPHAYINSTVDKVSVNFGKRI